MKRKFEERIELPAGTHCVYESGVLTCKKGGTEITKAIDYPGISVKVSSSEITISCPKGNKKHFNVISTFAAHVRNILHGAEEKFVYELETCNVHFPITLKVQGDSLFVSNFLGEKTPRKAKILPGVHVELKGQHIVLSSSDKDAAGQTAANFEKAGKVTGRDRRIYQDGIYIVTKPGRAK